MMFWIEIAALYALGACFGFWAMCDHYLRVFRQVTLGDAVFFGFLSIIPFAGPVIGLTALLDDRRGRDGREIVLWRRDRA